MRVLGRQIDKRVERNRCCGISNIYIVSAWVRRFRQTEDRQAKEQYRRKN